MRRMGTTLGCRDRLISKHATPTRIKLSGIWRKRKLGSDIALAETRAVEGMEEHALIAAAAKHLNHPSPFSSQQTASPSIGHEPTSRSARGHDQRKRCAGLEDSRSEGRKRSRSRSRHRKRVPINAPLHESHTRKRFGRVGKRALLISKHWVICSRGYCTSGYRSPGEHPGGLDAGDGPDFLYASTAAAPPLAERELLFLPRSVPGGSDVGRGRRCRGQAGLRR
jgi:hypothetical protein